MIKSHYLALCLALLAMRVAELPLEIGAPIPKGDQALKDISGKEITLNKAKQPNGLLVMFSGNDCPYIERNKARTIEICRYALTNQIGVVLINSNANTTLEAMKTYAAAQQYTWYYVADPGATFAEAFQAAHTPECYLFNQSGTLVYKGAIDDSPGNADAVKNRHLNNAINDLLAKKSPKVNSTQVLGCNIKRF